MIAAAATSGRVEVNPCVHVSDVESDIGLPNDDFAALGVALLPTTAVARDERHPPLAMRHEDHRPRLASA